MRLGGLSEAFARLIVRVAAARLSRRERERFTREWNAEIWQAARTDGGNARDGHGPVRMALGAMADAKTMAQLRHHSENGSGEMMRGFFTDVRVAARGLMRTPGFAVVAILTLGVGLGGATTIMTILDSIVLRPLPYPESDRLVMIANELPGVGEGTVWGMSTAQFVYTEQDLPAFEELGIYRFFGGNIDTPAGPVRVSGWRVTPSLFEVLGGEALLGRLFAEAEGTRNEPERLIVSEEFWRSQFGADPGVIGQTVSMRGEPIEIIGVLGAGFRLPGAKVAQSQLYVPLQIDRGARFYNSHTYGSVARLADGQTLASADAALASMVPVLPERFPMAYGASWLEGVGFRPHVTSLKKDVVGTMADNIWVLLGGVGLVLLIAVANVTNLFVVRVEERRSELSVRSALGAGVGTLARFLAAEAFVLTATGALIAIAIGIWGVPTILRVAPDTLPRLEEVRLGFVGIAATLGLATLTTALLVLYPLVAHVRGAVGSGQGDPSRTATAGRPKQRIRNVLVVGQVALALTLASGAGLLIQSLRALNSIDPGFETTGTMTVDIYLEPSRHPSENSIWQAYGRILDQVRALPGVQAAGLTSELPLSGGFGCTVQAFEEMTSVQERLATSGLTTCAGQTHATPGFFEAMGIPLVSGRLFEDLDNDDPSRAPAVVSQAFARRFWGNDDPLGKSVAPSGHSEGPFYQVVGVVGDIPRESVDGEEAMAIFYPMVQAPETPENWRQWLNHHMYLTVKTSLADPLAVFGSVRRVVAQVDPQAPVGTPARLTDRVDASMARISFVSVLMQISAAIALLLSAVGMYGVISYLVGRRTREIGMRMALGAEPQQIRRRIVAGSTSLSAVGLGLGLILAVASGRVLESLLYGVEPGDPVVLGVSAALLAGIAVLASWIPASRASRIDPVEALRMD